MELLAVRLINIRSFADVAIELGSGVIRIAGENGAGKTTIVAGVTFAFLGPDSVESRRYDTAEAGAVELDASSKLLRKGEAWGLAAVTFKVARHPGRVFRVHRVIGKRPKPRGLKDADPLLTEDAALVALGTNGEVLEVLETGKKAIAAHVARLLDQGEEAFAHAFKRIVAAPQGKLLQSIFEDRKERRDVAWRILGVDRYARAAQDATRIGGLLEARYLRSVERALAVAEQQVRDLEGTPELVKTLAGEVGAQELAVAEKRAARDAAALARESAALAVTRGGERVEQARRLAADAEDVARETEAARAALAAAEEAARGLAALGGAIARFEALRAEQGPRERTLVAFQGARARLEAARKSDLDLARREQASDEKLGRELAAARESEAALGRETAELAKKVSLAEREEITLAASHRAAVESAQGLGRWIASVGGPLAAARGLVASGALDADALEGLATTVPAEPDEKDVALVARAKEIADEVERRSGLAGAARARLEAALDLAARVGSGALCPLLAVACPHPRGQNLLDTLRETGTRERAASATAEKELTQARREHERVRAAQARLDGLARERQVWRERVQRLAPQAAQALAALERATGELAGLAGSAPARVRPLVQGLVAPPAAPIGQVRLFEKPREAFVSPAEWDGSSLRVLARALRARRSELAGALPTKLEERLAEAQLAAEHEAEELRTRLDAAVRRRENLRGQKEAAPARQAELLRSIARLTEEHREQAERRQKDALARSTEIVEQARALAAQGDVPAEHEKFLAALEKARQARDEASRLEALSAQGPAARERLGHAEKRASEVAARALALGVPGGVLSREALEKVARELAASLAADETRASAARTHEDQATRALLAAESALSVLRHRLDEAGTRARALDEKRVRLERLRLARDHVAHACSVLRGTGGAGVRAGGEAPASSASPPLAGALFKALSELPARLAERRVREVSSHARRIYRGLAPQETWDLVWDPRTYVLALAAPGTLPGQAVREGIAIDDMSGGQQMSAALALHLALVHTYARNTDLLFLDEPTTHLDARRRRALAECLRSLRAASAGPTALVPLRQVFVISHDDAFEGLQDQVVRVVAGTGGRPSTIEGASTAVPTPEPAREILSPAVPRKRVRKKNPAAG